jgi:hypothetical protein
MHTETWCSGLADKLALKEKSAKSKEVKPGEQFKQERLNNAMAQKDFFLPMLIITFYTNYIHITNFSVTTICAENATELCF